MHFVKPTFLIIIILFIFTNCKNEFKDLVVSSEQVISKKSFGKLKSGEEVSLFKLVNSKGVRMEVTNYGGIITSLFLPDRNGVLDDIVLGFDDLEGYVSDNPYFGAIIGRYGNRIGDAQFEIEGTTYQMAKNDGQNCLHGGFFGFDKVLWNAEPFENENGVGINFHRESPDMEEGFPGNLDVTVTYFLGNDNTLMMKYVATTDKTTVVNLTNHSYFNFTGMTEDILSHELILNAEKILPVDKGLIPTGELLPVNGTPFDFTSNKSIGADIEADHEQIRKGGGFDHCWVINPAENGMNFVGKVYEPKSGRTMEVLTTEPGVQFYSGNFLDGVVGKNGIVYQKRWGLCLETQHFPDSPNKSTFPSVVLEPGETFSSVTLHRFGIE